MKRAVVLSLAGALVALVACADLFDEASQCKSDRDCTKFGAVCDVARAVCVAAGTLPGDDASVALDTKDAKKEEPAPAAPAASETKEPDEPAEPERKREPEEPKPFPVVPWAVTGALAAATVVTGILASSAYGDYKDKRESYPISRDELDGAQSTARDLFVLSSVLGVGTVIAAGVSTYFTFFSTSSTQGPPPSKARLGLAVGPTGISIQGVTP